MSNFILGFAILIFSKNYQLFGALKTVIEIAKRLGISKALGTGKRSKLAMLQIAGRIITQGSRNYIANEWSKTQAIEELLKLTDFNEDSLYDNLDWLAKNQSKIEKKIFDFRYKDKRQRIYFFMTLLLHILRAIRMSLQSMDTTGTRKRVRSR